MHLTIFTAAVFLQSHETIGYGLVGAHIVIGRDGTDHLEVAIHLVARIGRGQFAACLQCLHAHRHLGADGRHFEVNHVEACGLRTLLIPNLVVAILGVERGLVVAVLVGEVVSCAIEVKGDTSLGILEEFLLVDVVTDAEDAHISP